MVEREGFFMAFLKYASAIAERFNVLSMRRIYLWMAAGLMVAVMILPGSLSRAQSTGLLPAAPGSFSSLVKKAKASVVNISTVKTITSGMARPFSFGGPSGPNDPLRDFFDRFFGVRVHHRYTRFYPDK